MGALGYVDDVAIISPSLHGLKAMLKLCEKFAIEYDIKFNPIKSKLVCYNVKNIESISVQLFGQTIETADNVKHLGNFISNKIWCKT